MMKKEEDVVGRKEEGKKGGKEESSYTPGEISEVLMGIAKLCDVES